MMFKSKLARRVTAGISAAVLASAMALPVVAFAEQGTDDDAVEPKLIYGTTTSETNTTQLALIYETPGVTNSTADTNNKVLVPAKIQFLAAEPAGGSLTAPSAVKIKNYSKAKVHVGSYTLTAGTNVTFASSDGNLSANNVYLTMAPGNATGAALEAGSAHELTGTAWNIDAGTDETQGELGLTFAGSNGDVTSLTTSGTAYDLGTISWTIASGHNQE